MILEKNQFIAVIARQLLAPGSWLLGKPDLPTAEDEGDTAWKTANNRRMERSRLRLRLIALAFTPL